MDCAQALHLIDSYADGELDAITGSKVELHLDQCASCQHAMERLGALHALISDGASYHRMPDRLRREIQGRVDRERGPSRDTVESVWWHWLRPAALVAITAVVTWTAASWWNEPPRNDLLAEAIVAGHARSMLTGHVADVASSDRHTVKPWLSSKLDFSPPVMDLSSAGFPLLGARLDYVDQRPVAVLVYGRRKHVINLFVWPTREARAGTALPAMSRHGYQVRQWESGDMTFWAISDLNAAELKSFAEQFAGVQ